MKCDHLNGYIYAIDFTPSSRSFCETCGPDREELHVNKYCNACKKVIDTINIDERTHFEFVDMNQLFDKIKDM